MNHRFSIALAILLALCIPAQAQMTDDQIIEYVQQGALAGKNQQQIGRELLLRGVSQSQLLRLKTQYEQGALDGQLSGGSVQTVAGRTAFGTSSRSDVFRDVSDDGGVQVTGRASNMSMTSGTGTPAVQGTMQLPASMQSYGADGPLAEEQYTEQDAYAEVRDTTGRRRVFGRSIFTGKTLTFEPNGNMATPKDYRLGPGDEVIIEVWGANEDTVDAIITPEGSIMVAEIGPVYLNGLTVAEAQQRIRGIFARKYAGVSGEEPASEVRVTLGQIRTILINVMGEVSR